ncbi:4-hydroxybutyrate CoA-transferase, partial [bacterium]|nr:4-hydroxybutyrate CoA-transferase [bacterium]
MCCFGPSVDITKSAAENAKLVIAQVNSHVPLTFGNSFINVNDIDFLVPCNEPLMEYPSEEISDEIKEVGRYVAQLVDDGSTVQLGIGRIPHAVAECLKDKKDLGIHTEMFTDGIINLIKSGAVTGMQKTINRGKIIASFVLGAKPLFDFIDKNPLIELHPSEYVNDPNVISQHDNMVAINVALEVDLTGQVCSDSIG